MQLREASERLGAQLDSVVEAYHNGFARAIQNYSAILALFAESKEQVRCLDLGKPALLCTPVRPSSTSRWT